jgi:hypothetical protein
MEGVLAMIQARIKCIAPLLAAMAGVIAAPLSAEVTKTDEAGFVTRDEAVVSAEPKEVWLALISPAKWWNGVHTWSNDAANLTLRPQAGGCFCERIPEDPDPDKISLEGSVEHMRVVQAFPEKALRMRGGLGPLQSEPATGVLTITMGKVDQGTKIVWEYVVGGYMRYPVPTIAKAVDGVMSQQLEGLATMLGKVDVPKSAPPEPAQEVAAPADDPATDASSESDNRMSELSDAVEALEDDQ